MRVKKKKNLTAIDNFAAKKSYNLVQRVSERENLVVLRVNLIEARDKSGGKNKKPCF